MTITNILYKNVSVPLFKNYSAAEVETLTSNPFQENSLFQLNRLLFSEYMQMPLMSRLISKLLDIRTEEGSKQGEAHDQALSSQSAEYKIISSFEDYFFEDFDLFDDDDGTVSELGDKLKTDMHAFFSYIIHMVYESMPLREGSCDLEINGVEFDGFGTVLFLLQKYDGFIISQPSLFQEAISYPISVEPGFLHENPLSEHFDPYFECNFISFLLVFGLVNVRLSKDTGKLYVCKTVLFDKLITIRPPEKLEIRA